MDCSYDNFDFKEIGKRIAQCRKEQDMTISELASKVGLAPSTISRYENGHFARIKLPAIEALAKALGVSPDWLIGYTNDPVDYNDPDLIASIPLSYMEACDGNVEKAFKMMEAVDAENTGAAFPKDAMPVDFSHLKRIPILGQISAGLPLYAEQNIEGYTYTDLNHGGEYFALRVRGDSMNAARIYDNDLLIVRKQDTAEDGEIVVAMVGDDEATVKYWHRRGNVVMLEPKSTNPIHQMQIYDLSETKIQIIGKVVQNQISY